MKKHEYIWLDGYKPEQTLRSKVKVTDEDAPQSTIMDERNKIAITRLGDTIRVAGIAHLTDFNKELRVKSLESLKQGIDRLFPKLIRESPSV